MFFSLHCVFLVPLFIIEELYLFAQAHAHAPTVEKSDFKPTKIHRPKMH